MLRSRLAAVALRSSSGAVYVTHRQQSSSSSSGFGLRDAKKMNFGVDPQKLDLGLDLDNMDFNAIMNETRRALANEKQGALNFQAEIETLNAALQRAERRPPSHTDGNTRRSHADRTIRGIAKAGAVHDANRPQAAYDQARRERAESREPRYTLVDSLRDASVNGDWAKSFELFEAAVAKSCQQALVDSTAQATVTPGSEEEHACFDRLRKVNMTLPTTGGFRARKNLHGVLRWNSNHVFWLLKVLFESDRIHEAQRVWSVLKAVGFLDYHLDARTLNGIIAMVRYSAPSRDPNAADDPAGLVDPLLVSHPKTTEEVDAEKAFRREVTMTLETLAQTKHMSLGYRNQKTAQRARIAEAIRRGEGAVNPDDGSEAIGGSSSPAVPLQVGDFTGLLRISQSEESSERVLAMMEKLGVPKTSETYAALIVALHNPTYCLKGVAANEMVPGPSRHTTSKRTETTSSGENSEPASAAVHEDDDSDDVGDETAETKEKYEAYKEKRVATARRWFHECPEADRRADVFNAMLYLLRSRSHQDSFDALLLEFRGAPLRTVEERATVQAATPGEAVPPIHAPQWRTAPNGKTFELLIQRARYGHDWAAMWDLYEEMRAANTPGTRKLYQALLVEARQHPPKKILERTHTDVSAFVMQLYEDMKKDQLDVHSLSSTLSVVNAWSTTRSHRRWS